MLHQFDETLLMNTKLQLLISGFLDIPSKKVASFSSHEFCKMVYLWLLRILKKNDWHE